MTQFPVVSFSVTYRLAEYLAIVREHTLATALADAPWALRWLARALVVVFGSAAFLVKSRRVGTCHFRIDDTGITRRSRHSEASVGWDRVVAVHVYAVGYLVELRQGAMPIPFRVLTADQRDRVWSIMATCVNATDPDPTALPIRDAVMDPSIQATSVQ